jgi:hypothetical protein
MFVLNPVGVLHITRILPIQIIRLYWWIGIRQRNIVNGEEPGSLPGLNGKRQHAVQMGEPIPGVMMPLIAVMPIIPEEMPMGN